MLKQHPGRSPVSASLAAHRLQQTWQYSRSLPLAGIRFPLLNSPERCQQSAEKWFSILQHCLDAPRGGHNPPVSANIASPVGGYLLLLFISTLAICQASTEPNKHTLRSKLTALQLGIPLERTAERPPPWGSITAMNQPWPSPETARLHNWPRNSYHFRYGTESLRSCFQGSQHGSQGLLTLWAWLRACADGDAPPRRGAQASWTSFPECTVTALWSTVGKTRFWIRFFFFSLIYPPT